MEIVDYSLESLDIVDDSVDSSEFGDKFLDLVVDFYFVVLVVTEHCRDWTNSFKTPPHWWFCWSGQRDMIIQTDQNATAEQIAEAGKIDDSPEAESMEVEPADDEAEEWVFNCFA